MNPSDFHTNYADELAQIGAGSSTQAHSIFRLAINDLTITAAQLVEVLYLAESKTDLSVDGISLAVTCYVKWYRVEKFLDAAKNIGAVVTGEDSVSKLKIKHHEKDSKTKN